MYSTGWEISLSCWASKGPRPAGASPAFPAAIGALQVTLRETSKIVTLHDMECILLFLRTTALTHATDRNPKCPHLAFLKLGEGLNYSKELEITYHSFLTRDMIACVFTETLLILNHASLKACQYNLHLNLSLWILFYFIGGWTILYKKVKIILLKSPIKYHINISDDSIILLWMVCLKTKQKSVCVFNIRC